MYALRATSSIAGATTAAGAIGVDTERKIVRGYIVAELGPFITEGRGQFDSESLDAIVSLMRAAEPMGLPSRFTHPTIGIDHLGLFLGRAHNPRRAGDRVLADLHLNPSAFVSPRGNLGGYVLTLAKSDPAALGSSLVLDANKLPQRGGPPIWRPTAITASDLVAIGDATPTGLLPFSAKEPTALEVMQEYSGMLQRHADREMILMRQRNEERQLIALRDRWKLRKAKYAT